MRVIIKQESVDNIKAIYEINRLGFGQDNEAKLVDLLRNSNAFVPELSLVAFVDDQLVGHILFSKITIVDDHQNEFENLGLAPMAVKPDYQKQGIGGLLIKNGLEKARELNYKSVIVLGHEHYYPRFGFAPASRWNIKAPFDVPSEVFMAIELVTDGLKGISGTVKYPKEFEGV
ncbi:N-acetyltransferase [Solitalea sp. MAHUQ-68]|uniref:N-acetyltransferase n=1 Tax=Solitalea agri TaxID=2953739 RepID=A0A9X2JBJ0_9SPHI|nr:N-acetyltransferase [Solitalea agri]MCO4292028.1 N-acetyltransferase [Solitalea agri]